MMNLLIRTLVVSIIIVVTDIYFYKALKNTFFHKIKNTKALKYTVVAFTLAFIVFEILWYLIIGIPEDDPVKYRQLYMLLNVFIIIYLPKSLMTLFLLVYDIFYLVIHKFFIQKILKKNQKTHHKPRWVYILAFAILSVSLLYCIYGFTYNKTNVKILKTDVYFENLPESFNGFKIVQISDIHLGSYTDTTYISRCIKIIKDISPDMLCLTGDMINVSDKEVELFKKLFTNISFPYGKYSILGNHDIGDYFKLKSIKNQQQITQSLIQKQKEMGFILLIDSACYITKGNDSIAIVGVNNCGNFPFKHSGNLPKALDYLKNDDFVVLLSHDPNHWRKEVLNHKNIYLTLSGHTHAMQIAFISDFLKLSPSMFIFPHWHGLYNSENQFLYVNAGLGYSGFSGRIGVRPEITVITLYSKK